MNNLSLYFHWPYCLSKCPYCNFNSHVREAFDEQAWLQGLKREFAYYHDYIFSKKIKTIFFGGGTPSLMSPGVVENILSHLVNHYGMDPSIEITLEANPNSVEVERFAGFKAAGINRVSVGIQSLDAQRLKFLGRQHSVEEALKAMEVTASLFKNYSYDFIYARPNENIQNWCEELDIALKFGSPHISLYQLTIEPGTKFFTMYNRGDFELPDEDLSVRLYKETTDYLRSKGLYGYEVSNYAKPGFESKHNSAYWQYDEYLGLGPGAHSRICLNEKYLSRENHKSPEIWQDKLEKRGQAVNREQNLNLEDIASEYILMGLRLEKGVDYNQFRDKFGLDLKQYLNLSKIDMLSQYGFFTESDSRLILSFKGRLCLDKVAAEIIK